MPPKKKVANGYKFAEPLPKGTILEDIAKAKWKLGPSIGKGGFGEIYSAQSESAKGSSYPYVVKIEPHSNGPLFVEINFYIRNLKQPDIDEFKKSRGLKTLGMPVYLGSGSHGYKSEKYRFLVMEKFGTDLYKLYIENGKKFPTNTAFQLGIQILDTLEYIHSRGYVHADIKGANILMGLTKETQNKQVFLVDFGLATRYTTEKEFKPNPKKAHDGTIEYLSRDAHQGVQTRRGDLEILAYNMIQWLGCTLPWENNLGDPKIVQQSKETNMAEVAKMIKACFKDRSPAPKAIVDFLKYLHTLKFDTDPDYKKIRKIFTAGVKDAAGTIDSNLSFSSTKTPTKRKGTAVDIAKSPKRSRNSRVQNDSDSEEPPETSKKAPAKRKGVKKDSSQDETNGVESNGKAKRGLPKKRTTKTNEEKGESTDNESNEESDPGHGSEGENEPPKQSVKKRGKSAKKAPEMTANQNGMEGYTEAMKQIMMKIQNDPKSKGKKAASKKPKASENGNSNDTDGFNDEMKEIAMKKGTRGRKPTKKVTSEGSDKGDSDLEGFNDEMKEIAAKKKGRKPAKIKEPVPIATTSKAKPERGLVKVSSRRLLAKPPSKHLDVVMLQENCESNSDC